MVALSGSTVLITGGASGIGRLTAERAAARGATVVILDLDEASAQATAERLRSLTGRPHHAYTCDVGDRERVYALAEQVREEVGTVDVLINNAGIISGDYLLQLPDEKIEATYRVNVLALYWMTKAFLPDMLRRNHGHVVTIASAGGLLGVAKQTDYSASKAAAISFDEALRHELRELAPGVRTTMIGPYYINTGMFDGVQTRFRLLLPILEQDDVADKIVASIEGDRRRVIMPWFAKMVPLIRILPVPLFDRLVDFFGINRTMADFRGRGAIPVSASVPPEDERIDRAG
jgi:all-trans-retinol dehydrogenase (NAD+)